MKSAMLMSLNMQSGKHGTYDSLISVPSVFVPYIFF